MTTNEGGGTHPGDPWSPDFQSVAPESPPEDEWPYDESLTLSEAEREIAGIEDDDEPAVDEAAGEAEASEDQAEEPAEDQDAQEAAAREAEEAAAREAEEAAAREAEALAAKEAEEAAAKEAEEAAAREAEALAAKEAEEAGAKEAEEAAAREAEALAAKEAEEAAAPMQESEPPALRAVADADPSINAPMEEVAVEDLQAEPEWLEAVEEMTLDDIADEAEGTAGVAAAQAETPTEVIESLAVVPDVGEPIDETMEDVEFEFVDIDDADLRADTAEHLFEALDIEEADRDAEGLIEDVTGEFEIIEEATPAVAAAVVPDPPPVPDIDFEVSPEFDLVSADVDNTRDALAAFMASPGQTEERQIPEVTPASTGAEVAAQDARPETTAQDQVQLAGEPAEVVAPAEVVPLTAEEELIASLSGDLTIPDFETFVQEDFARDYVAEPTQEHRGLAETIAVAGDQEASALSASMPGVDHGHVGFQDIDEDLHFDDPDAPETEEEAPADEEARDYGSDLTLRAASGIILIALLAAALWAGGVVFLIFIGIVAVTAQIEFYSAVRKGGYRPLVLFGLLGGIGALIGTYAQGTDVLRQGPVAVPAALAFTLVAIFAWYGSQEHPPSDPWRNGLVTFLGAAWIPALLALVLPMAEVERSERFQLIIVLLLLVAAFDVGSYFVGRALGSRKFSPVLSPNKTIEGFIGGVVATLIVAFLAAAVVDVFDFGSALAVAVAVIVAAPLGDLAESLMKRSLGIKDMGQLIPGHGGVLDRIDSYLFAVPLAYLVLRWTGLL